MMRFVVTLLATIALSACNPSADLAGANSSTPDPAARPVPENSLLPREIAGSWRFAEEDPDAYSFTTVVFEGDFLVIGESPGGIRDTMKVPLSELAGGMYRIEWGDERTDYGAGRNNVSLLCGHGGKNWPWFVRLRLEGSDLVTEFHKIDQSSGEGKGFFDPWPEPCLTLRWER
ncbi:MAG: hypothetical protein AAF250_10745 [Pseudomonadota bacterium]